MAPAFQEVSENYFIRGADFSNEAHTVLASPSEGTPEAPTGHWVPEAQLDEQGSGIQRRQSGCGSSSGLGSL